MTNLQKTILFFLSTILGVVLVIFFIVTVNQKLNTATTSNTVTFSGEGRASAKPDIAKLNFSIVTQAATSEEAKNANATKSNQVSDFLKKQNIDSKDIRTSGYQLYPQQTYGINGGTPRITGYQASQNFTVTIRDLDNADTVLSGVVAAGVNQVEQLQFALEDPDKVQAEARAEAVANARAKAKQLESQVGIHLGKIVNFQENSGGYPMPMYALARTSAEKLDSGVAPSLPAGENEVVISVSVTYQIK